MKKLGRTSRLRGWVSGLHGGQLLVLLALETAAAFLLAAASAAVSFHNALLPDEEMSAVGILFSPTRLSEAAEALAMAIAPRGGDELELMVGAAFWIVFVVFGVGIGLLTIWWWFGARAKPKGAQ